MISAGHSGVGEVFTRQRRPAFLPVRSVVPQAQMLSGLVLVSCRPQLLQR